jgi:hypothetical protein
MPDQRRSFTRKASALKLELDTEVLVAQAFNPSTSSTPPPHHKFRGIWDTGATNTAISPAVVDQCSLSPIGMVTMHTANGAKNCSTYLINIILPNAVAIISVRVACANLAPGTDVLIGMDIITQGDFAITNKNGETWFIFRAPSIERYDFVVGDKYYNEKIAKTRTKPTRDKTKKKLRRKKKKK